MMKLIAILLLIEAALCAPFYSKRQYDNSTCLPNVKGPCWDGSTLFSEPFTDLPEYQCAPPDGWMKEPSGLCYDKRDEIWHVYYQYNLAQQTSSVTRYWGHSTSKDLLKWESHPPALEAGRNESGILGGSVVIDYNNTSGFFNGSVHINQRFVAIYTVTTTIGQVQYCAYSVDNGYSYIKWGKVLDIGSNRHRDPKVFWHQESRQWIMIIVKQEEYAIEIYGSTNLRSWRFHSRFVAVTRVTRSLDFFFESPNFVRIKVEGTQQWKWVLTLAVKSKTAGSLSSNDYFIGDFDGYKFSGSRTDKQAVDLGEDFYGFQSFSGYEEESIGLAWASNWRYAEQLPTSPWKGSMTFPRTCSLRYIQIGTEFVYRFVQKVVYKFSSSISINLRVSSSLEIVREIILTRNRTIETNFPIPQRPRLLDLDVKFRAFNNSGSFDIYVNSAFAKGGSIRIGFDGGNSSVYVDRSTKTDISNNPIFTDRKSVRVTPQAIGPGYNREYEIYGVIDRNFLELYVNQGAYTLSYTFFLPGYPGQFKVVPKDESHPVRFDRVIFRQYN